MKLFETWDSSWFCQRGFCLLLPIVGEGYQADTTLDYIGFLLDHTRSSGKSNCWWAWGSAFGDHFFFLHPAPGSKWKSFLLIARVYVLLIFFNPKKWYFYFIHFFQEDYLHRRSTERHSIVFFFLKLCFHAYSPWLSILCYSNQYCKELLMGSAAPFVLKQHVQITQNNPLWTVFFMV